MGTGLRATALIGREPEVGVVRRRVAAAASGTGGVLLVTGQAGVGKSRLIHEIARSARTAGMVVLLGRATEGGGPYRPISEALLGHLRAGLVVETPALRPFREALSRLLPGWVGTAGGPGVDPVVVLGEGVLRLLTEIGGARGCVVLLEDLHWSDPDTLALLHYLADPVADSPLLLVGSAREEEGSPTLTRLTVHDAIEVISLRPLDREAVARLAVACANGATLPGDVVDFLATRAEGLPLLVQELLEGLVAARSVVPRRTGWEVVAPLGAQVPRTLAELVRRRRDAVPLHLQRVIDAAAVLGRDVDWTLLAPVSGANVDEVTAVLRAAVSGALLEPTQPGGFRFRHALMREAVLGDLLPPERVALSLRAAEVLQERDPHLRGEDGPRVAELYASGGAADRAAAILVTLGASAIKRGALRSAEDLLQRATALGAGTPATVELVQLLALSGRADEALHVGAAALPTATGDARADLRRSLARAAIRAGRWDEASRYLDRMIESGDPRADALAADAAFGAGSLERAQALAVPAVAAALAAGLPAVACEALEVVARCLRMRAPAEAGAAFRRGADLAEEHGLVLWRIRALFGLATVQSLDGTGTETMSVVRALALDAGMLGEAAGSSLLLAEGELLANGPSAAAISADAAVELAASVRLTHVQVLALLVAGMARLAGGLSAEATDRLDQAVRLAPATPDVTAAHAGARALGAVLNRDLPVARDWLDAAVDTGGEVSTAPLPFWGLWALVRTVLGDRDAAARTRLAGSAMNARAVNRGGLLYAEAIAAGRAGEGAVAVRLMREGDLLLAPTAWWRTMLRLIVLEAAVNDGWGDPVAHLRVELAALEESGERRLARSARDLLRTAGVAVPRRGRGDSDVPPALRAVGVTSREMDVLGLVSEGLTNAQVAERLFLSPRTVDTHVANLLAKTGTTNRAELIRYAGPAHR